MAKKRKNILDHISGEDAIAILKLLAKDKQIAKKINRVHLKTVVSLSHIFYGRRVIL